MTEPPLLAAQGLRVDVDGAAAIEGATFETHGASIAVVGDGDGLLRALAGKAEIRAGALAVLGLDVGSRAHFASGDVGIAPLDPPLPPRFHPGEYLEWAARLSGLDRTSARENARRVMGEMGLDRIAKTPIASLVLADRRALVLAQAVVAQPRVLVLVAPISGLSGQDAHYVSAVLEVATKGRRWIASLANLHAASEENVVAARADELLVFASGRLVRQAGLRKIEDGAIGYTLMLRGRITEFRDALRSRGVEMSGGPQRFFVELPPGMKAQELVALSVEVGAALVELVPRIFSSASISPP